MAIQSPMYSEYERETILTHVEEILLKLTWLGPWFALPYLTYRLLINHRDKY